MDELDLTDAEKKATYQEIKDYSIRELILNGDPKTYLKTVTEYKSLD